jgi:hypothetical protein
MPLPPNRLLTIVAQDPSLKDAKGKIVTARISVPHERLDDGPRGFRVQVVDYDASNEAYYTPIPAGSYGGPGEAQRDPFAGASNRQMLEDPAFHAQNVYAIVMRTLARFEFALGRRVAWSFGGHQIKVAPHAFAIANAFYSSRDEALLFGYFPRKPGGKEMVFSCLSHDVVAHEATHALLDGLRERYTYPSSPEQAAFHEGFADIVAMLSVFSLPSAMRAALGRQLDDRTISKDRLTRDFLTNTMLFGLAEQLGEETSGIRGNALRRSILLPPSPTYMQDPEFLEPHRRGEILVAAVMNAFLRVWQNRLASLGELDGGEVDLGRVEEEGAAIADRLLTMSIRALDYCPPTDIEFCDFLSALLTGDREVAPDDTRYRFRDIIRETFKKYGIQPTSKGIPGEEPGIWEPPDQVLDYSRCNFESMQRDGDEVFRFVWDNRDDLGLCADAFTKVQSVRPCVRLGPDGLVLRETVAEYVQVLTVMASELQNLAIPPRPDDRAPRRIEKPAGMPDNLEVTLYGGGALVFDQYGRVKFHVRNAVLNAERQSRRLEYLWRYGFFRKGASAFRKFSVLHQLRMSDMPLEMLEEI